MGTGSSIIAMLGGAMGRHSELEDEKRKEAMANRRLLMDSLLEQGNKNWDIWGPEERTRFTTNVAQIAGVKDPNIINSMVGIAGQVYPVVEQRTRRIPSTPQATAPSMPGATPVPQAALQPPPELPTAATVPTTTEYGTAAEARQAMQMQLARQRMEEVKKLGLSPEMEDVATLEALGVKGTAPIITAGINAASRERVAGANIIARRQLAEGKLRYERVNFSDGEHVLGYGFGGFIYDYTAQRVLHEGISQMNLGAPPQNAQPSLGEIPSPKLELGEKLTPPVPPQIVIEKGTNRPVQLNREEMRRRQKRDKSLAGVYPVEVNPPSAGTGTFSPVVDNTGNIRGFYNNKNPSATAPVPPELAGTRKTGLASTELTQRAILKDLAVSLRDLDRLSSSPENQDYIGPVRGRIAGMARGFISYPTEVNEMFRLADNMGDILLRARSGAQINEREYARLRTLVPNPREHPDKFFTDLRSFKREMKDILSVRGLDENGDPSEQTSTPAPPSSSSATPDSDKFRGKGKTESSLMQKLRERHKVGGR